MRERRNDRKNLKRKKDKKGRTREKKRTKEFTKIIKGKGN